VNKANRRRHNSWYANLINHLIRLVVILFLIIIALEIYKHLLSDIITTRPNIIAFIILWLFSAYLVLPRVNRFLAKIYLPNYFIGRAQTGDGLLGDPINIAVYGGRDRLIKVMTEGGWQLADQLSLKSGLKMIYSACLNKNYTTAPVSSLYLFNKKQDLAFEKIINNNPKKRHHIRFWSTPEDWWLPGGYQVQYLGAATFDKHVGISLFTGQITHKIDADVDKERDFVLNTIKKSKYIKKINLVEHFSSSYHSRNGGGDIITTDGAMPFVTLS